MTATLGSIVLPDDILWTDEYQWSGTRQNLERSLGGRLFVQHGSVSKGRPITLNCHWLTRATLDQLEAARDIPGATLLLTLPDARVFSVVFRHHEGEPIQATPIIDYPIYDADDVFTVTLKLMEV